MTDGVLLFEAQLRHRSAERRQEEDRIVAEAATATRRVDDYALAGAFAQDLGPVRETNDHYGAVPGRPFLPRNACECPEKDVDAVVMIAAVPAVNVMEGTGSAAEGIYLEAGVIGERGQV